MQPAGIEQVESINDEAPKIKVYRKRWLVLITFSLTSLGNALLFTCITSINNIFSKYYRVDPAVTDWAANTFSLTFVLVAIPSSQCISYFGLRTLVLIGSSLNAICTCLHFAGINRNGVYLVMAGQFAGGLSVGAILQVPARLSSVWFPEYEHTKATCIAMAFNILGLGIGFIQPSYMVPDSSDPDEVYNGLFYMYLSHIIFLGICLSMVYLFFDEKPPLPPSYARLLADMKTIDENSKKSLKSDLKKMLSDKNFLIMTQGFGIYFGAYNFFITCLNEMVSDIISDKSIGWLGFISNIITIISVLIFSSLTDKFHKYKLISLILTFGALLSWGFFSFVLLKWKNLFAVYVSYNLLSFFGVPFFVIGIEYVAEMTYPVPEDLSSAVILISGSIYNLIYVTAIGHIIDSGLMQLSCFIVLGAYALVFVLVCIVKEDLKRHQAEVSFKEK